MVVAFTGVATYWERGIKHCVPSTGEALEKELCEAANTSVCPGQSSRLCRYLSHFCRRPEELRIVA